MKHQKTILRAGSLIVFLVFFLGLFAASLYDLQVLHGAEALERSSRKITIQETVTAARGEITDRNGVLLVSNRLEYDVELDTTVMGSDPNGELLALAELCSSQGVSYEDGLPLSRGDPFTDIRASLTKEQQLRFSDYASLKNLSELSVGQALFSALCHLYEIDDSYTPQEARQIMGIRYELDLRKAGVTYLTYTFAKNVDIQWIAAAKEQGLSGGKIVTRTVRTYHTDYAAHVLGRVGQMSDTQWAYYQELGYSMDAHVGKDGVEAAFESYLHGEGGVRISDANASGKSSSEMYAPAPEPGQTVMLTLDIALQEVTESALASFIEGKATGGGGAAVVIDVTDGGILTMASYPTYDLSQYSVQYDALSKDTLAPLFNRATLGTYAPGSVFKMVTATGALEEAIITTEETILDTGRYTFYQDYRPMCWLFREEGDTHGAVNVTEALEVSCNVFFYDVGRRLTIETLNGYARKFGLGEATGIELPESTGTLAGPEASALRDASWEEGSVLAAAIGQSDNAFTPLQLCNYIATLVNGGTRYAAHLLKEVKSYDYTSTLYEYEPSILDAFEISDATGNAVKAGMLAVTQKGAVASYFSGLSVTAGAKTGSAQVGTQSESNAVFVCFAPYDDPEIAIAIVAEKSGSGYELGEVAAAILEAYFQSDGYPKDGAKEQHLLP